ncbi:MAG: nucleotide exchange factor GrpE [Bacteroidota bacterium]
MSEPTPQMKSTETGAAQAEPAEAVKQASAEARLAEANTKLEEQREATLRALAEADNARKRALAEAASAQKYALERFVETLLPVIDSLEAALGASAGTTEALRSGVELTLKQLRAALEKANVRDIDPAPGTRFDPNHHQAMAAVESGEEPNTLVAVLQKGWRLHERVLRPALVTVAKPRPANDA